MSEAVGDVRGLERLAKQCWVDGLVVCRRHANFTTEGRSGGRDVPPLVVGDAAPIVRQAQRRVQVDASRQRRGEPERPRGNTSHKEGFMTSCSSTILGFSPP